MERTFDTNRTFADLGIIPPILKALKEMGFEHPTEVRGHSTCPDRKDLIVMAKTEAQTAVFGIAAAVGRSGSRGFRGSYAYPRACGRQ